MRRIHLFEFTDLNWFPDFLRDYLTDFLQFLSNRSKIYKPVLSLFVQKLQQTNATEIIDLASGGGGGLLWLNTELRQQLPEIRIVLTDYFPNKTAFEQIKRQADNFSYETLPVDARNVPQHLKGFRTQFLSLHHFKPEDARKILQNAVDSKNPIAIFEAQDRTLPSIIAMLLSPVSVLLTTPFIRPFSIGRLFFTYILPIVPLCVLWDGLVSCFRTYSVAEMQELVAGMKNRSDFEWSIGKEKMILYLIGIPRP